MQPTTRERTPSAPPYDTTFRGWNVRNHRGRVIDTVFFLPTATSDEVWRQLVSHDGYPASISVERA